MDTQLTKSHPPNFKPNYRPYVYREPEVIAWRLKHDASVQLLLGDGRSLGASEFIGFDKYSYFLVDKTGIPKIACIGVFPSGAEALVVSKTHPAHEVPTARTERVNDSKMQVLYPEHRVGFSLKVILVNGWELVGKIDSAGQYYVALQLSETQTVHLYRHAIADYAWVGREPPAVSPQQAQKTRQQLKDLSSKPQKLLKKPSPQTALVVVQALVEPPQPAKPLSEVMKEEAKRTMVNAKMKIVLREMPVTVREVGDLLWIPLQNQPGGVPKGFELSPMSVELVVSKKMWKNALKKAEEQKQQTGNEALYLVEALIGMYQNLFCALASSIQVAEAKSKAVEPKRTEDPKAVELPATSQPKAAEPMAEPKPKAVEITVAAKAPETKKEAKPTPAEKPKEPETTASEAKAPKKRVFNATPDGIEVAAVIPEERPAVIEVKAKSPRAKPRAVEVTYASPKPKK